MTDGNGLASEVPSVGIFWGLPAEQGKRGRIIVGDRTPTGEAEPYGDCLTHERGHYEVWEGWQSLGPAELHRRGLSATIAFYEYEHFPRGRVVYNMSAERYVIYADRWLQNETDAAEIVRQFGLNGEIWSLKSDDHYRTRVGP